MTRRQDDLAALDRVLELVYLLDQDMTQALARDGLTKSRAPLVWDLHQRGPSTQRALAESLGTSPRNVTGLVDGLVDEGFVTREPHPKDRRAVLVSLTPYGEKVMARMAGDHVRLAEQLFGPMSRTDLDGFTTGLASVVSRLHALVGSEAP